MCVSVCCVPLCARYAANIQTEMLLFIKPGTRSPQMIPLDARAEEMKLALFNRDN